MIWAWVTKNAALAGLYAAAAVLAGFMIYQTFFAGGRAALKHEEVKAKAEHAVGAAQGEAGANAANVVAGNATKETIIREITRTNTNEIFRQPGAGDPVADAVDAAGRRAICMRSSAAGLPDCNGLRPAGPN